MILKALAIIIIMMVTISYYVSVFVIDEFVNIYQLENMYHCEMLELATAQTPTGSHIYEHQSKFK